MATTIIGVDFSGAKNNDPWVAQACLRDGKLALKSCYPLPREELTERLLAVCNDPNAVIGMDFPFGVPKACITAGLKIKATSMSQVWGNIPKKDNLPQYVTEMRANLRKCGDLQGFNKCMRQGDATHFNTTALSPLNPAQPEMFPMTFYGMRMLHTLWTKSNCQVPPLCSADRKGAVLLETMPGAVLAQFGFERTTYKNYKKRTRRDARKTILDELPPKSKKVGIELDNLDKFADLCIGIHDCLDAVVAAIAAAAWSKDPNQFLRPGESENTKPDELAMAQLEGWLYAPKPASNQS